MLVDMRNNKLDHVLHGTTPRVSPALLLSMNGGCMSIVFERFDRVRHLKRDHRFFFRLIGELVDRFCKMVERLVSTPGI